MCAHIYKKTHIHTKEPSFYFLFIFLEVTRYNINQHAFWGICYAASLIRSHTVAEFICHTCEWRGTHFSFSFLHDNQFHKERALNSDPPWVPQSSTKSFLVPTCFFPERSFPHRVQNQSWLYSISVEQEMLQKTPRGRHHFLDYKEWPFRNSCPLSVGQCLASNF